MLTERMGAPVRYPKKAIATIALAGVLLATSMALGSRPGGLPFGTDPAAAERVPSCVHTNVAKGPFGAAELVVYNRCAYQQWGSYIYGQPDFAQQPDPGCTKLIRNHRNTFPFAGWWNFRGIDLCNP